MNGINALVAVNERRQYVMTMFLGAPPRDDKQADRFILDTEKPVDFARDWLHHRCLAGPPRAPSVITSQSRLHVQNRPPETSTV